MMDLELAVMAGIPLISCTSNEVFLDDVFKDMVPGKKAIRIHSLADLIILSEKKGIFFYYTEGNHVISTDDIERLIANNQSLVVVNYPEALPLALNVGPLITPRESTLRAVTEVTGASADEFYHLLKNLTIYEVYRVLWLCQTLDGAVSEKGILKVKGMLFQGVDGIHPVDTSMKVYLPDQSLERWVKLNKQFFLGNYPEQLVPRGILLDGPTGTGKTSGAKYIANEFQVPLFRLSIPSLLSKWHGLSEHNFEQALSVVSREEPCVMLVDEVDKLFGSDEEGVTKKILSSFLWWLAEHKERVLVVMTTNSTEHIPSELIRAGRIDQKFWIKGMPKSTAMVLAERLMFSLGMGFITDHLTFRIDELYVDGHNPSGAEITRTVYHFAKEKIMEGK